MFAKKTTKLIVTIDYTIDGDMNGIEPDDAIAEELFDVFPGVVASEDHGDGDNWCLLVDMIQIDRHK